MRNLETIFMDEYYLIVWRNDNSHFWYRKLKNRQMAEAYMNFSKMYLLTYDYRYMIRSKLLLSESTSNLGPAYDRDLLSFVYKNFESKIYEKFRKNVIECLPVSND